MWNRISCLSIAAVLLTLLFKPFAPARAQTPDSNLLVRAQEEFSQGEFNKSLLSFREYLRRKPLDQDAWTRFAAAYYHTGQARQALDYLNRSKPSDNLKSFHSFYRALSYDAIGEADRARKLLARLSKGDDTMTEAALFEKTAIEFGEGDAGAAKVSAEDYKRRFKNGRYRSQIDFILEHLAQAGKVPVPESQRLLYVQNFYATHPLSLMNLPHSWVYQLGYEYIQGEKKNPAVEVGGVLPTKPFEEHHLIARAGLSLGPFVTNTTKSEIAYVYGQDWGSDSERLNYSRTYPTDLEFFPFRPDLMERSHRIIVDSKARTGSLEGGVYGHIDFRRGGSSLFPAPERPEIRKGFSIGTHTFVAPYFSWYFLDTHNVKATAYFEKFIDAEQNDFSYKTFNLSNSIDDPYTSFSLMQESRWGWLDFRTRLEYFRWTYIYNDFWEGYTNTGYGAAFDFTTPGLTYFPALVWSGRFIMADRDYASELIKTGPCSDKAAAPGSSEAIEVDPVSRVSVCRRKESTMNMTGGVSWVGRLKQTALTFAFDHKVRDNTTLSVYDESASSFLFIFTQAFPSLDQGARLLEPPRGLQYTRPPY